VILIILASGCCFYIVQRTKAKWVAGTSQIEQFENRIEAIEARLSDIQDIVISIDDQLKRSSHNNTTPTVRELS
jgi:hypothetical protein